MPSEPSRSSIVLAAALRLLRPLVRLLIRHGVAYPAFAASLKSVFLEAAREELRDSGQKSTDAALSLLSGVHRRDIRTLSGSPPNSESVDERPRNLASEVVTRWISDPAYLDAAGLPLALPRYGDAPSFDSLVQSVSGDIRARALLAELSRLGIAESSESQVRLLAPGFVPREGFAEMVALLGDNVVDHLAAAAQNLDGKHNFLEQAIFVDELTQESVDALHLAAAKAWQQAFRTVMREAQARFDHDQLHATPEQRTQRARFGSYFYGSKNDDGPSG